MRIMTLPCDGIGPEIMAATLDVVRAADARYGLGLSFQEEESGFTSLRKHGITLREEVLDRARTEFDGVILGTQSHMDYPPVAEGGRNVSAGFRIGLDLYANVRPARSRAYLPNKAPGMDLVIMREATEGFYPDRNMHRGVGEMMPDPDMALSVRKITRHSSMRICREAFKLAMQRRKKVTAIHKANSFLMTDGLFLECFRAVAKEFPEVETEDRIVDAFAALLVRQPEKYDVVVATNFYGDILSDLASELSGSLGLAGSINANAETGLVCAQAQHGSAPDIAGRNVANPTSLILSAAMMLSWLGEQRGEAKLLDAGAAIARAVDAVLEDPAKRTRDIGGTVNTDAFGRLVADAVAASQFSPVA
ncbi:isocitrate/isopropylmalate dehydrogenase family protein [Acuticoccus kandeliae]|uniref:isocitrate/isopropylmalate dehydrogenase family protein n=1 Tax=Acuticoccus kandeliae TaxID=2073160 RepID=UPI000D3ED016|nr:isocitrate/isopropylmalate dehydrogenase family protein [Acuticoccus kandeliae]